MGLGAASSRPTDPRRRNQVLNLSGVTASDGLDGEWASTQTRSKERSQTSLDSTGSPR
jgi:hypothetical protein